MMVAARINARSVVKWPFEVFCQCIKYQFCVHYGVLVHEGNVVTVKGGIMHERKASPLSTQDRLLHC